MSIRLQEADDDIQLTQSPSTKPISTYKTKPQQSRGHYIYLSIIVIIACTFICFINKRQPKEQKSNINIQQLTDIANKLSMQSKNQILIIKDLKEQVQYVKNQNKKKLEKEKQDLKQKKNTQLKNQKKNANVQQKIIVQEQSPGRQKPIQKSFTQKKTSQKQPAQQKQVQIINKQQAQRKSGGQSLKPVSESGGNKQKDIKVPTSMTPQLKKISQKRKQKPGMRKVQPGSVSEVKYGIKNSEGKKIQEVLYDAQNQQARKKFYQQRVQFLSAKKHIQSIYLVTFNTKLNDDRNQQQKRVQSQQYERINKIWNFQKYTQELPMCLIVPGYNNNAKFRIQYNLNSIFQQNYTNYFVVIINDASKDNSDLVYRNYLNFYNINKDKYAYIQNTERKTALQNIYIASHDYCSPDSVVLNLDADDQFIGKNVLKIFNAAYQKLKAGVVYSNFYWFNQGGDFRTGFTSQYLQSDKNDRNYRRAPLRISHLRSYRNELFLKVNATDFQDSKGKFYRSAYDLAMYFPMMELSCGRGHKIEGFHYLYNFNTGNNDYIVDRPTQARVDSEVRGKKKYECDKQFDAKMRA